MGAWVSVALILGGSLGGPEGSGGGHNLSCEGWGARATARARRTRTPINTMRAIRDSNPPAIAPSHGDSGKSPPEAAKINIIYRSKINVFILQMWVPEAYFSEKGDSSAPPTCEVDVRSGRRRRGSERRKLLSSL